MGDDSIDCSELFIKKETSNEERNIKLQLYTIQPALYIQGQKAKNDAKKDPYSTLTFVEEEPPEFPNDE